MREGKKLDGRTRRSIKNCLYLLEVASYKEFSNDELRHAQETLVLLRELYEIGEHPGPAFTREEVSPQEWKEPSSTGAEKGGQRI
jgi:hypothetical protein